MASNGAAASEIEDLIYEAAFVPDLWPEVLERAGGVVGAITGEHYIMSEGRRPLIQATPNTLPLVEEFFASDQWTRTERPAAYMAANHPGFLRDVDFMSDAQIERDPIRPLLARINVGWQLGAAIPLPMGDMAIFSFGRRLQDGPAQRDAANALDQFRPHLARSAIISAKLRFGRARAAVEMLQALGLGAAIVRVGGRVVVGNALFDAMQHTFVALAFGKLAINDDGANAIFRTAVSDGATAADVVRSIPVPGDEDRPSVVIHVLPLRRNARDLLLGGDFLVVATPLNTSGPGPSLSLLSALYDLTPAESKIAAALVEGLSLKEASARLNITYHTSRSHLAKVFEKTGARRQPELVAMLKNVSPTVL